MRTLLIAFFLSVGILSVCNAQKKMAHPVKYDNCKEIINKFYPKVKNIKTEKTDKLASISCVGEHTLSNHSDIKKYFHKISDENNYYYVYDPKIKGLVLRQRKTIIKKSKKCKGGFSFGDKKLNASLTSGSTVYMMKLKTNGGKKFRDYVITNAKNHLVYDNSFATVLFFKVKEKTMEVKKDNKS